MVNQCRCHVCHASQVSLALALIGDPGNQLPEIHDAVVQDIGYKTEWMISDNRIASSPRLEIFIND